MQSIKDATTAYLDYRAGQLDVVPLPAANVAENKGKKNFLHFPSTLVNYLSLAVDLPPFDNVHCRLAVAYAIDTAQINKTVLHGTQTTIHDMVPKGLNGYYNGKDEPQYNPAKARDELSQCPGGIKNVKLTYGAGGDADLVYGSAIPAMLAAVGIDVKPAGVPANETVQLSAQPQKTTGVQMLANALGSSSPAITCRVRQTNYVLNTSGWSNPQYDALCAKALRTFDPKKQAPIYQQAQHLALSQASWITMGQVQNFYIGKSNIAGLAGDTYYSVPIGKGYDWSNLGKK